MLTSTFILFRDLGTTCMKIELKVGAFSKSPLRSGIYEIQDHSFNGKPFYYNNQSARCLYWSKNGVWVVMFFLSFILPFQFLINNAF